MSYDLTLQKKKEQPFEYDCFKTEVMTMSPLADQEPIFGDDLRCDPTETILYEVKYDPKTFHAFLKYLKEKGVKMNFFARLFKKVDRGLACEFYRQYRPELPYEDVLMVFTDPSNEEEFREVFRQLRVLAQRYNLVLDDPQLGGLLDLEAEEPKLKEG
ncbi:MAG TPA: hypothetical protein VHR47_13605 [Bacillota bacterium]|nr:hypothetical protein [Bacillota bacterium]